MTGHDWVLVAPWWHWPRPGQPARGRGTPPALQKYDTSKLVETFLADPQRRLEFLDGVDRVVRYTGEPRGLGGVTRVPTKLRKLFLPTHFRHYLVACSLHCDSPGLPPVDREQVCQAGFVVRKRSYDVDGPNAARARDRLLAVNTARRALTSVDTQIAAARRVRNASPLRLAGLQTRRDGAVLVLNDAVKALQEWAAAEGVHRALKGWYPDEHEGRGAWRPVTEVPVSVDEDAFPLYPLVVPPSATDHDAAGQAIWFGLVPAGSADHDTSTERAPRFDDASTFEMRCFVRRHAPACLNTDGTATADCRGQVVWSEPTEGFGLAAHFDLRGTANRPVTVQLPDLVALKAQAGTAPAGVQFRTPPHSQVSGNGPTNGTVQICSFSIPLITIVALFVFQLFLPIVVLLFQLWFLLLLKLCIPPEVELDAGSALALALDIPEPQLAVDVGLQVQFDTHTAPAIGRALGLSTTGGKLVDDPANAPDNAFKTQDRLARRTMLRQLFGKEALAQPVDDLVYAERVERREVLPA